MTQTHVHVESRLPVQNILGDSYKLNCITVAPLSMNRLYIYNGQLILLVGGKNILHHQTVSSETTMAVFFTMLIKRQECIFSLLVYLQIFQRRQVFEGIVHHICCLVGTLLLH